MKYAKNIKRISIMQTKLNNSYKNKNLNLSKLKIDLKIFNKQGKIESAKILNLSSFIKKKLAV